MSANGSGDNNRMPEDSPTNQDKFDAVLRRLISAKPQTEQQTKAKAKAERTAKKAAKKK